MAEFYAAIGGSLDQDYECTVHRLEDIHGEVPYRSPLFRANYYSVVLLTAGATTYIVDDSSHRTRPGTVYFTNPGHVKGFEVLEPSRGFVITFSEAFLKETVRADVLDDFPFLIAESVPPRLREYVLALHAAEGGAVLLLDVKKLLDAAAVR